MNEITNKMPAPLILPADFLPSTANSLPWSLGSLPEKSLRNKAQRAGDTIAVSAISTLALLNTLDNIMYSSKYSIKT